MTESQASWQEYDSPPVVEAVLAVEFESSGDLGILKLAALAQAWIATFPIVSEQPPLPPTRPLAQGPGYYLDLGASAPQSRIWLAQEDQRLLVQVQSDRLVLNWRKLEGELVGYPGFPWMFAKFAELLGDLERIVFEDAETPTALVTEWAYVNKLSQQALEGANPFTVWRDPSISDQTFPLLTRFQHVRRFVPGGSAEGQISIIAEPEGPGDTAVVNLTISARCFHEPDTTLSTALERGRTAHDVARRAFDGVTTDEAKTMWGVRQ